MLSIGQVIRRVGCSEEIPTGEVGLRSDIPDDNGLLTHDRSAGPIWLATNFLLIESLQRFHQYYGADLQVECPTGSGDYMDLGKVAEEIQHRVIHIFGRDMEGRRATNGGNTKLDRDPHFRDYVWFHEVSSS